MNKEDLIKKWLDDGLTSDELLQFQQLEEYDSYIKLAEKSVLFKAPDYNVDEAYLNLSTTINRKREQKSMLKRLKPYLKVAAILVIGMVVYPTFFMNNYTNIETLAMEQKSVDLPDASVVELNAFSSISFNEDSWNDAREVSLKGEAYFKVKKGSKFDVKTSSGIVTVVGTEFNIKNRTDYFEVKCFEGKVNVTYNGKVIPLPAGNSMRVVNNALVLNKTDISHPYWIDKISNFESVPLSEVIAELERQYNIKVKMKSKMEMSTLFSGSFSHSNRENAIKSIAVPFGLDFTIMNDIVTLQKIE